MVAAAEVEIGCVVVAVIGGKRWQPLWWRRLWYRQRIQVVGGPKADRLGQWRGFILQPGQQPRHPQDGRNQFFDFRLEVCLSIEKTRWLPPSVPNVLIEPAA